MGEIRSGRNKQYIVQRKRITILLTPVYNPFWTPIYNPFWISQLACHHSIHCSAIPLRLKALPVDLYEIPRCHLPHQLLGHQSGTFVFGWASSKLGRFNKSCARSGWSLPAARQPGSAQPPPRQVTTVGNPCLP